MEIKEKIVFVDNTEGHLGYSYEKKFSKLFNYKVQKDLLRWCIYSITLNDPAHDLAHVYGVCCNGMEIFDHYRDIYGLNDRQEMIVMLGCLMHDLGCRYNRKDHHLIGYGLVYEYINRYCPGMFAVEDITEIATCVLEHRSSNKSRPTTFLSEIVSVADSGQPDIDLYIGRAIKFRLSGKAGDFTSREEIIEDAYIHLLDKFGENGYHWDSYSPIGLQFYIDEWDVFKSLLNDKERVMEKLSEQYNRYINEPWVAFNLIKMD